MSTRTPPTLRDIVQRALDEDIGRGDLTSLGCLDPNPIRCEIIAKQAGVLSGSHPATLAFDIVDSANTVTWERADGDRFTVGDRIATIEGFNQTVFATERVALNFLQQLSGVATATRALVDAIGDHRARILDTRKTAPGLRLVQKEAVVHGGGLNHRFGLYDMVLIKDNHIASAGSITAAISLQREFMSTSDFRLQFGYDNGTIGIEVEVETAEQITEAIAAKADRLLLDNRTPDELIDLVNHARRLNPAVELEASGNVSLKTVAAIAASGVDYISVGAVTHSAPAIDLSMLVIAGE